MTSQQQHIVLGSAVTVPDERRRHGDRRRHSWRTLTYCGLHGRGRRRHTRRRGHNYYLDWYDPRLVLTGLAVLLMSSMDALFTLNLLSKGAYETNFFMAQLLQAGNGVFVITKIGITAVGVLFLLMHANFHLLRITSARRLLQIMVPIYGLLIAYEIVLLGVIR